jgi:Tat protein secretion system quality control protein TatD with DNase activity
VDRLDRLVTLVAETPMIGEIGLDHHWVKDPAAYPAQMRVLEFFLAAVRDQEKVVNLHTKSAEREVAQALRRFPSQKSDSRGITVTYRSAARAIERPGRAAALA